jgi:hypothetical protein
VLGVRTLALEIDHFFDSSTTKDVMAPARAFSKAQMDQEVAKIFEADVRVTFAAEYLLERFLWPCHDGSSLPRRFGPVTKERRSTAEVSGHRR